MSYSRWGNSRWYTYFSGDNTFVIAGIAEFNRRQLDDIDACINEVRKMCDDINWTDKDIPREKEYEELREYMQYFIEDFDNG